MTEIWKKIMLKLFWNIYIYKLVINIHILQNGWHIWSSVRLHMTKLLF